MSNVSEHLPTRLEMIEYLKQQQEEGYTVNRERAAAHLGTIMLLAVLGPTAAGKSTLVNEVASMEPSIHLYESSTTRPRTARDGTDYRTDVPLEEFYTAARNRSLVNYYVHPSQQVYGTFLSGFSAPVTIGAIGTSTLTQLRSAPFYDVQALYTIMEGNTYAERLGLAGEGKPGSRINQPDILPRLQESLASLSFARAHYGDEGFAVLELSNEPGVINEVASSVIELTYGTEVSHIPAWRAHQLLGEMTDVTHAAIDHAQRNQ